MMYPLVLRISAEEKELLEEEAKRQNQSLAEINRRALRAYFKNKSHQKGGAEMLLEWANKHKKSTKGPKNVSSNYKKYLYGQR